MKPQKTKKAVNPEKIKVITKPEIDKTAEQLLADLAKKDAERKSEIEALKKRVETLEISFKWCQDLLKIQSETIAKMFESLTGKKVQN
ncbi:MAG: hypothetical protein HY958_13365 [Bacteroidia bacterium]|nr:hypothetical protein [Bacteroidia bacterium]